MQVKDDPYEKMVKEKGMTNHGKITCILLPQEVEFLGCVLKIEED